MSKSLYVGVRVEISNRFINNSKIIKNYNKTHKNTRLSDFHSDGKIFVERRKNMLIARGVKSDAGMSNSMANFSMMSKISGGIVAVERIIQIVNILGNDRLIRERIKTFVNGNSVLNNLPELNGLSQAFMDLDSIVPGFIRSGWYYAPEALFK
jgi:hypothetical protein